MSKSLASVTTFRDALNVSMDKNMHFVNARVHLDFTEFVTFGILAKQISIIEPPSPCEFCVLVYSIPSFQLYI